MVRVTLEINHDGKVERRELKTGSFLRVGRSDKSHWIIKDEKLSGAHCEFNLRYNCLVVTDLKSKNGTYVNGVRIDQVNLYAGDSLKIGDIKFLIKADLMDEDAQKILFKDS